jgi:trimeric autotransporter adhesin
MRHPVLVSLVLALTLALLPAPASRPAAAADQPSSGSPALAPPGSELTPSLAAAPYGTAVAISGDTAAVTGFVDGCAVIFVFARSAAGWAEQARLLDPAAPNEASVFGSALALSGDTLAVGAGAESAPVSSVYVYTRAAGAWSLQARLLPPRAAGLGFGAALALAGDTLVAGVPGSVQSPAPGAAYVFARAAGVWSRQAILTAQSPAPADRYGRAVAVAHQHVVVGGPGYAEVFDLKGGSWRRTAVLHGGGSGSGTSFGSAVAASLETAAVADPANQRVSLFIHTRSGWFHQTDIAPPGAAAAAGFGAAISLSQDALAVGAPGVSRGHAAASGAVYVYFRQDHSWSLDGAFGLAAPAAGEGFGSAVAVSLHTAVVGSAAGSPVPQSAWLLDGLDNP